METPTIEQVHEVYTARAAKIDSLREEIAALEARQVAAEQFMLQHDPKIDLVASIYVARRSEISGLEKAQKEIKARQEDFESWFAKRLKDVGTEAFRTESGTVYTYRGESVTVGEWDTFVEQTLLLPAAEKLAPLLPDCDVVALLREAIPFYFLNKAVSKTVCLEQMGEYDEKSKSRPNPPPMGVNYVSTVKVGVRKA